MTGLETILVIFTALLGSILALPSPDPRRIPTRPAAEIEKISLPGFSQVQPSRENAADDEDRQPGNPSWVFNQTCSQLTLGGRGKKGATTLGGTCRDQDGVWWDTSINLNLCFANDGGVLQYRDSGNFDNECRPCILSEDGTAEKGLTLKCNCLNPDGMPQYTFIGMGPNFDHPLTVKAVAGRLICGDQIGNKSPNFAG
ncbi:hypothetical protein NLU13_0707 [Sarocladium strictum]|uniref:Cyanovirin-N domain-containing protein n=1 Tax=Sarocladium strictum TaxID=5046 RepID=A0AA39GPU7_SARSR|nr:hypothetical protein NLU13_0707 [Sarocladium strictum]